MDFRISFGGELQLTHISAKTLKKEELMRSVGLLPPWRENPRKDGLRPGTRNELVTGGSVTTIGSFCSSRWPWPSAITGALLAISLIAKEREAANARKEAARLRMTDTKDPLGHSG
jgi:hypothetical protein